MLTSSEYHKQHRPRLREKAGNATSGMREEFDELLWHS